ncbi:MAG: hypothetical protein RR326_17055, partial [Stenotrophomonas sp.]
RERSSLTSGSVRQRDKTWPPSADVRVGQQSTRCGHSGIGNERVLCSGYCLQPLVDVLPITGIK